MLLPINLPRKWRDSGEKYKSLLYFYESPLFTRIPIGGRSI